MSRHSPEESWIFGSCCDCVGRRGRLADQRLGVFIGLGTNQHQWRFHNPCGPVIIRGFRKRKIGLRWDDIVLEITVQEALVVRRAWSEIRYVIEDGTSFQIDVGSRGAGFFLAKECVPEELSLLFRKKEGWADPGATDNPMARSEI